MMKYISATILLIMFLSSACLQNITKQSSTPFLEEMVIDSVWAANKVSFAIRTVEDQQYVAYYDRNRMMTVAKRNLGSSQWAKKTLPNRLKWDSHNYVALGIDESGYIHVSGNMHVDPLVYFRSTVPFSVDSFEQLNYMVGQDEDDVTYPKFLYTKNNDLLFSYRSGSSGNGNSLINRFDPKTKTWSRYLHKPLFKGISDNGNRSAYHQYRKDSKGNFHYIWMWRWTPDVETSHQICYAMTPDLIHWKTIQGKNISLPFTPDNPELIVDPTPSKGGMHNGKYKLILTEEDDPIIVYLKYDEQGYTQMYLAKHEGQQWVSIKLSDWDFRWKFTGGGDQMTKGATFELNGFNKEGLLWISWWNIQNEEGNYYVDVENLKVAYRDSVRRSKYPKELYDRLSSHPKMSVNLATSRGNDKENIKYFLKWESMKKSHGRHAPDIIPEGPISPLKIIGFQ